MSLVTALPALAEVLATYVPTYGVTDLGTVYERATTGHTPDSVGLDGGRTAIGMLAPYQGQFDTDGKEGRWATAGSGAHVTDEDTILVVCFHGVYEQTKIGTLQLRARPYPRAVRATIRRHNRLQVAGDDALWRVRATAYRTGWMEWGGKNHFATQITVILAYDEQLTPGDD